MAKVITKEEYANVKNILLDPNGAYVIEVQVSSSVDLKAGAILGGATSALEDRNAVLGVVNDATAQGVLLWDLPAGDTNGVMVVRGVIDSSKIEGTIPSAVKTALTHIIFRNGEYL